MFGKKTAADKSNSKIALSKTSIISQASQYASIAVLVAGIFLGVAIALINKFSDQIAYNAKVIAAADESILEYSTAIKNAGICTSPKSKSGIYTKEELEKCNPESIEVYQVPGTLRAKILNEVAANEALNSVPKEESSACVNEQTGKNYTYTELQTFYDAAENADELTAATNLIQSCSALRVIPDALPDSLNEAALLTGLNKIFDVSGWEPESISPTGTYGTASFDPNLDSVNVQLTVDSTYATAMTVLNNIERSIREFSFSRATIEWSGENRMSLHAQASAYYINPSAYSDSSKSITKGSE